MADRGRPIPAALVLRGLRLCRVFGWSEVRAARECGIDRMTLRKYLGKRQPKTTLEVSTPPPV